MKLIGTLIAPDGDIVSASVANSICARNDCQIAVVKNLSPVTNRQLRNYVSKYVHSIAIRSPHLGAHVNRRTPEIANLTITNAERGNRAILAQLALTIACAREY